MAFTAYTCYARLDQTRFAQGPGSMQEKCKTSWHCSVERLRGKHAEENARVESMIRNISGSQMVIRRNIVARYGKAAKAGDDAGSALSSALSRAAPSG